MELVNIDINEQIRLLREFGKTSSEEIKENAIKYLKSGLTIAFCPTKTIDKYDESKGVACVNPKTQTDGKWTWSSVLIYYLENYNIALPDEFIQHMRTNSWVVDKEKAKSIVGLPDLYD